MPGSCNDIAETLCLHKDVSGDVSALCGELEQHQITGVRYIFSQYTKEKPGVILNYPSGCGNSVQVVVFISAIYEKLKKPVLILYDDTKERDLWMERFARWTNIEKDEIALDSSNTYLKKQIFINSVVDLLTHHRRYWSIVVVKGDEFMNIFKKIKLKVDFKIWLTSQDLKKERELLHSVYTWMYPSDSLLRQYLEDKSQALFKDDIPSHMIMDLLLEDVLWTRKNLVPFGSHKRKHEPEVQPPRVVTKKNKDATGTKIKRSKKPPEVPSTSTICIENVVSLQNLNDENALEAVDDISNKSNGKMVTIINNPIMTTGADNDEESKMDVESFIRDNDPVVSDSSLNLAVRNLDNIPQQSDPSSPNTDEVDATLSFASAIDDIVKTENNMATDKCEDSVDVESELITNKSDLTPTKNVEVSGVSESTDDSMIETIPGVNYGEKHLASEIDVDNQEADETKSDQEISAEVSGSTDQEGKLKVSTNVMKETDNSFDSKIQELEEKAIKKFKGSVLDNIF